MRQALLRTLVCAALIGSCRAAPVLTQEDDAPALRFPTLPGEPGHGFVLRPGARDGGNPGVTTPLVQPDKRPPAEQGPATEAEQLDDLFRRLAQAGDADEAKGLALAIQHRWLASGSDTADLLMTRSVTAVGNGDLDLAGRLLDKIVALDPTWVEAWNKRATLRYLKGDDVGAMEDIAEVLTLEPRHFGALSGMSSILERNGMQKQALALVRRAIALYPHNADLEKIEGELRLKVEGRDI